MQVNKDDSEGERSMKRFVMVLVAALVLLSTGAATQVGTVYAQNCQAGMFLGGNGNSNTIDGGSNNDEIHGGGGNDTLRGHGCNDQLFGGNGNDHISGGAGDDQINGGPGFDVCIGGPGNDVFVNCEVVVQ
jgi:Ca2+-binding RTX toxin-like protein